MKCKICDSSTQFLFEKKVLNKFQVKYFHCNNCDFVQTEEPFWLEEAYKNAITALDRGLVQRNIHYYPIVSALILRVFNRKGKFLDYGGGYGLFVRIMRDLGFDFYRLDLYCENLFAKHFDIGDVNFKPNFELITAFEVFEHLTDPVSEMKKMLSYGNSILFSTEIHPGKDKIENWEYVSPETGQHIAFYSVKTLRFLAEMFQLKLNTNKSTFHLFTNKSCENTIFYLTSKRKVSVVYNALFGANQSLTLRDHDMIRRKLNASL